MNKAWIIARRELDAWFDSLVAYIIIVAFLAFSGIFTWIAGADIFLRQQADLSVFFGVARWTLFFFIPAITMRLIAEEKRAGTIELVLTKNVTDRDFVLGKFVASVLMVAIALACTLPYYATVAMLGPVDHGATLSGYLGLLLLSAAYIAIGLFASSLSNNQIVAFLLALFISIFFQFLFDVFADNTGGWLSRLFDMLSAMRHYDSIARGVIDSKDLIYFLSVCFVGLALTEWQVGKRE